MKQAVIRQLTTKELHEQIEDEKTLYTRLKLNHTVSTLDNPLKLRKIRRNIARLITELKQRTIKENSN
ncbi:MAG: 50S ribosomal protein L29 [Bacteroidia bacterium]|nr:50S ribosomal protein L29 [Bacteroidia bacterium]